MKKICVLSVIMSLLFVGCANSQQSNEVNLSNKTEVEMTTASQTEASKEEGKRNMIYSYETKEIWFDRDGMKIYGLCYIPEGINQPVPTIIISHGFTGSHRDNLGNAQKYAEAGYAVCSIDFCGGSYSTASDGSTMDMSVMTEVEDLIAVVEQLEQEDFVKTDSVYLWGESQGGFAALAFDPSFIGESGGEARNVSSPDINTEN